MALMEALPFDIPVFGIKLKISSPYAIFSSVTSCS